MWIGKSNLNVQICKSSEKDLRLAYRGKPGIPRDHGSEVKTYGHVKPVKKMETGGWQSAASHLHYSLNAIV